MKPKTQINPMSTADTTKSNRKRNLDVKKVDTAKLGLEKLAVEHYDNNIQANFHKRTSDKARKELYKGMKEHAVVGFDCRFKDADGREVLLTALISAPTGNTVDVQKLRKLVTEEQFIKMASVTQAAIEEVVGTAILNQCLVPSVGTENVTVKAAK